MAIVNPDCNQTNKVMNKMVFLNYLARKQNLAGNEISIMHAWPALIVISTIRLKRLTTTPTDI
jgi:hypothetical protein